MAYVRIAKLRDALELAPTLGKADLAELAASTTASPLQCLVEPFVRECRPYTQILNAQYDRIYNYVDARNKKAIRWLKFVGFTIDKTPYPVGPDNTPFLFLYRIRG